MTLLPSMKLTCKHGANVLTKYEFNMGVFKVNVGDTDLMLAYLNLVWAYLKLMWVNTYSTRMYRREMGELQYVFSWLYANRTL